MRNLSKSKYLNGIKCRKLLWVAVNDAGRIPQLELVLNLALCDGLSSRWASSRWGREGIDYASY
jgi:hypothetical protein